ncbi:MAG TPA: hypothetical protein VFW08_13555 [bacterium]|nr:hypothetical protein [bacterium]
MFTEWFDLKRPAWNPQTLAALLRRLQDSGYQGLTVDYGSLVGRYASGAVDRILGTLAGAEEFADVLIPPAQPQARIIVHRREPTVVRVVIAARSPQEVRLIGTALKVHLEAVLGKLGDQIADDRGRGLVARFRKDVLPMLRLTGNGERAGSARSPLASQLLRAMPHQPVVRGRPTVLASQAGPLAPDRPLEQIREAFELLAGEGVVERWHVVLCREKGAWLGSSANAEEMRTFSSLAMDCPHCGRAVREEPADVAYRLSERASIENDNRWLCELVESALRRHGAESVAVHPGGGAEVDGAACYQGALILFRAKDDPVDIGDLMRLAEQGRRFESDGWRVFPLLVADRPLGLDTTGVRVTVVEGVAALDGVLEQMLKAAREAVLANLLPAALRPAALPLSEVLPQD